MFGKKKTPEKTVEIPKPVTIDDAYEKSLVQQRQEIKQWLYKYEIRGRSAVGEASVFSLFMAAGILASAPVFVFFGAPLVIGNTVLYMTSKAHVKRAQQALDEIESRLTEYRQLKERLLAATPALQPPPMPSSGIQDPFQKTATPGEINKIKNKMAQLEKQMRDSNKSPPQNPKP